MESECLFCKIAAGQIPTEVVYEDDDVIAFKDIRPQAPVHVLVIPRKHIPAIAELADEDASLVGELVVTARKIAAAKGLTADGYRLVFNNGPGAGQDVYHVHLHLLGGRRFTWPPG
ncbi:MAG: histidine triad nucleotide-binding protein [Actinobacteria bacterium]|nr:histidine triad nucleotide-binding protein [Actinomycetota bacterium]